MHLTIIILSQRPPTSVEDMAVGAVVEVCPIIITWVHAGCPGKSEDTCPHPSAVPRRLRFPRAISSWKIRGDLILQIHLLLFFPARRITLSSKTSPLFISGLLIAVRLDSGPSGFLSVADPAAAMCFRASSSTSIPLSPDEDRSTSPVDSRAFRSRGVRPSALQGARCTA